VQDRVRTTLSDQIGAGLLCFGAGSLYGWSGLSGALKDRFLVGATEVGEVFSLAIVSFAAAIMLCPRLPSRFRGLRGACVAGLFGAAATALATIAPDYTTFLACFSFGMGATSGAIYVFALELGAESPRPGLAAPIMVALFGLGGAVFGPTMRLLVEAGMGLAALWTVTATLIVGTVIGIALSSNRSAAAVLATSTPTALPPPVSRGLIIFLWLTFAFGSISGLMCLGLALPILVDRGASVQLQSLGLLAVALANTLGRLTVGWLQSVLLPARIVAAAASLSALGVLALLLSSQPGAGVVALFILAAGYGLTAAGIPVLTRKLLFAGQFRNVFPIVLTGWGAAGLLSPWLTGVIRDATGSFNPTFVLCAVACSIALALSIVVDRKFAMSS
jgi:hypothetical protein